MAYHVQSGYKVATKLYLISTKVLRRQYEDSVSMGQRKAPEIESGIHFKPHASGDKYVRFHLSKMSYTRLQVTDFW